MKPKPKATPRKGRASVHPPILLKVIPLDELRLEGNTQTRNGINEEAVADYASTMTERGSHVFPPVVVFIDANGEKWLADGFHRVHAAKKNGLQKIKAEVHRGSRVDALLYNLKANQIHGVRRTQADKRRSIELVLMEKSLCKRSSREIAKLCGVGHQLVENVRRQQPIEQVDESSTSAGTDVRIGGDEKAYRVRRSKRTDKPKEKAVDTVAPTGTSEQTEGEAATDSNGKSPVPASTTGIVKVAPFAPAKNVDDNTPVETHNRPSNPLRAVVLDTHDEEESDAPTPENSVENSDSATSEPQKGLDVLLSTNFHQYWNEDSRAWKEVHGWLSRAHDKLPLDSYTQQEKEAFDECFTELARGVIGMGEDICPEHQAGAHVSVRAAVILGVVLSEYLASRVN